MSVSHFSSAFTGLCTPRAVPPECTVTLLYHGSLVQFITVYLQHPRVSWLPERSSDHKGYSQFWLQNCFHKFVTFWKTCLLLQCHCSYFQGKVLNLLAGSSECVPDRCRGLIDTLGSQGLGPLLCLRSWL